ncbi:MAG: ABC transporter permease [Dehalococcoidales bacterium]|nr:ABC transporter permease [Dehalococcoidales bacterium]
MATYTIRRLVMAIVVLLIVSLLVFFAVRMMPGDPILMYLTQGAAASLTPEQIEEARHELGLDLPIMVQYFNWISDLFHGDLGKSLFYREDVGQLIAERVPITLNIGVIALLLGFFLGTIGGIISALKPGKLIDTFITILANIGITVPVFWLGIILIYFFGLRLNWLPMYGYTSPMVDLGENIRQLVLPVFCVMVFDLSATQRQMRSSMLEVIRQDYVRTAWAKGLNERVIVIRHILKNSIIPVITLNGMGFSMILGGQVLIETVFNIPGIGSLAVNATLSQDYAVVQACVLLTAVMVVLVNFLVDISYGYFDPRIRYD